MEGWMIIPVVLWQVIPPILYFTPVIVVAFSARVSGKRKLAWIGLTLACNVIASGYVIYLYYSTSSPQNLTRPDKFTMVQWMLIVLHNGYWLAWLALIAFFIATRRRAIPTER